MASSSMLGGRSQPTGGCAPSSTTTTVLCQPCHSISSSSSSRWHPAGVRRQPSSRGRHHTQQQPHQRPRPVCAATGPGGQQPPQPPPLPADEDLLPRALVAIGLNGSIAVAGAALVGVNLPGLFHFDRQADIVAALLYQSPLLLLEAALFIPNYQLPTSLLQQQQPGKQQDADAVLDVAAVSQLSTGSPAAWQAALAGLSMVIRRTPQQQQLALPAALGLMALRETTKELLQRGFVLAGLAGWLTDRLYEADVGAASGAAGVSDAVLIAGVPVTVPELGLLSASVVATLLFSPAAYIAAEEAAAGVSGALLLRTEAGGAVRRIAAAAMAARPGSSSSGSSAGGQQAVNDAVARLQPPPARSSSSSSSGAAAAASGSTGGDSSSDEDDDPSVLEYRLVKATGDVFASAPVRVAYSLSLSKELGRLLLSNLVFAQVTSQNLAATLAASLAANALLLLYGRAFQQPQAGQK